MSKHDDYISLGKAGDGYISLIGGEPPKVVIRFLGTPLEADTGCRRWGALYGKALRVVDGRVEVVELKEEPTS